MKLYKKLSNGVKKIHLFVLITMLLAGITFSVIQVIKANPDAPNPGHSASEIECDTNLCIATTTGRVGIGTVDPGAKLEVVGQIKVTGGSPGAGKVLTSDAFGLAIWQTFSGSAIDHGILQGLLDDDHTQYLLVSGTRAMTGNLSMSAATENDITAIDELIGYDDLRLKGRADEGASIYYGAYNHEFYTSSLLRMTVTNAGNVEFANQIKLSGGSPSAGKVLTSDASGLATWQTLTTLPSGTSGQTLRHNGTAWVANSVITNNGTNITSSGNVTLSGTNANIILGSNYLSGDGGDEGVSVNAAGTVFIGNGTGKLTVGTIDPVYNVQGTKYATYMSGMLGVKEETTGNIQLANGEYTIDFNNLEQDSDLYIFYRITDFGENWNKLTVLLSAEGPGGAWYKKEPQNNRLVIYSQTASSVSFRLTAPRFDWQKWLNVSEDGEVEGLAVEEIINNRYIQSQEQIISDSNLTEAGFIQQIKEALSSFGLVIDDGIAKVKQLIAEKITADTAEIGQFQTVDKATGQIYCLWIEQGEWVKVLGECRINSQ